MKSPIRNLVLGVKSNALHNIITFAIKSNATHYFCMTSNLTEIRLLSNVSHNVLLLDEQQE